MLFRRKLQEEKPTTVIEEVDFGERRDVRMDRRKFGPPSTFPLIDSENKHVPQDRRSRPERRLNNIIVRETNINLNAKY